MTAPEAPRDEEPPRFEYTIPGWTRLADMPQASIDAFAGRVPAEVLDWWAEYGLGMSTDGRYQIIDPLEWHEFIEHADEAMFAPGVVPLLVTWLGDVLTYEDDRYCMLNFRHLYRYPMGSKIDLLMMCMNRVEGLAGDASYAMADAARERLGPVAYGQIYGFNLVLPLGGAEEADELHIVNAHAHLYVITAVAGPITINSSVSKYRAAKGLPFWE